MYIGRFTYGTAFEQCWAGISAPLYLAGLRKKFVQPAMNHAAST
jgi:hypothetical protein